MLLCMYKLMYISIKEFRKRQEFIKNPPSIRIGDSYICQFLRQFFSLKLHQAVPHSMTDTVIQKFSILINCRYGKYLASSTYPESITDLQEDPVLLIAHKTA